MGTSVAINNITLPRPQPRLAPDDVGVVAKVQLKKKVLERLKETESSIASNNPTFKEGDDQSGNNRPANWLITKPNLVKIRPDYFG